MKFPIGVEYDYVKLKYIAKLGPRVIGEYWTSEEAAKAYNQVAMKVFSFPILNKLEEVQKDLDIEEIKWYDKVIEERVENGKKEEIIPEEKQSETNEENIIEILAKNLNSAGE